MSDAAVETPTLAAALVSQIPELEDWWRAYSTSSEYLEDAPTVMLGDLSTWLVDNVEAGRVRALPAFFANVEALLARNPERSLVTVGLLEGIQNVSLNRGLGAGAFDAWMPPLTSKYWRLIYRLVGSMMAPTSTGRPAPGYPADDRCD